MLKILMLKRDSLQAEMKALVDLCTAENRVLTEAEQASFVAKKDELALVKSQIDLVSSSNEILNSESGSTTGATTSAVVLANENAKTVPNAPRQKTEFDTAAEFIQAALAAQHGNKVDQRLVYRANEAHAEQSMGTGSKGGFMIPKRLLQQVIPGELPSQDFIRPRAFVVPAGSPPDGEIEIPAVNQDPDADGNNRVYSGVEVAWLEEGGAKPETDASLRMISLKPKEVAGYITLTDKLLRNWTAAGEFASRLLRAAIVGAESRAFIQGSGIGQPKGVLSSGALYKVNRTTSNTVTLADVKTMYSHFSGNPAGSVWLMNYALFSYFLSMTGDGGGATNIIQPGSAPGTFTLYGIPVERYDRLPAVGALGDFGLYDFSHYLIKDGSGPFLDTNPYTEWKNNKTLIKAFWNVDGQTWSNKVFKNEQDFELSRFVALDVPAAS